MSLTSALLPGALILYSLGLIHSVFTVLTRRRTIVVLSLAIVIAGFCAHTAWLVTVVMDLGHLPIFSTQEVFAFLAWAIIAYYLMMQTRRQAQVLSLFVFPIVLVFMLVALVSSGFKPLPSGFEEILRTPALPLHVGFMMFAYAAFFLSFISAAMYLVQERQLKLKQFGAIYQYFPSLSTCDALSHRSLIFGFLMLTLGIGTGALLVLRSDPVFWRGDPIIVLAIITWLMYVVVVHYRLTAGWHGRRAAVLLIVGFLAVTMTFLGARIFGHII